MTSNQGKSLFYFINKLFVLSFVAMWKCLRYGDFCVCKVNVSA